MQALEYRREILEITSLDLGPEFALGDQIQAVHHILIDTTIRTQNRELLPDSQGIVQS